MLDGFAHLDLTVPDPVLDFEGRLRSAGLDGALVVETWKGEDYPLLDRLLRQDRLRLAFCFRNSESTLGLIDHAAVFAIRSRGSQMQDASDLVDRLDSSRKYLLVHCDQGIGRLTDRILDLLGRRPQLKVYVPHLGWPVLDAREDQDWKRSIERLAGAPSIVLGISAIEHFSQEAFPHDDVKRYAQEVLGQFGPDRVLAGSDYPLFDKSRYAEYIRLANDWIREVYPDYTAGPLGAITDLREKEPSEGVPEAGGNDGI